MVNRSVSTVKVAKKRITVHKLPGALRNGPVQHIKNPVPHVPPDLFQLHSLCAFIGPRGKGKTHAMVNLTLKYLHEGSFNRVFLITPTYKSNRIFHVLDPDENDVFENINNIYGALNTIEIETAKDAKKYKDFKEYLSAYKKYSRGKPITPSEDTLLRNNQYKKPNFIPRPSPLLIVDDMSHTDIYSTSHSNPFPNLCLRHRHINDGIGITIFMATQTFKTGIPKAIRQNIQQFFLWPTNDLSQLDCIYEEIGSMCTKEVFEDMYRRATRGKHNFLTIDSNAKHHLLQFRKNFDTILVPHNTEGESDNEESKDDESKE